VGTNYQNFGGDRGSWVFNRIIIVRCDNVIPENRRDKNLVEHLLEEKEYIVSLAIRCLRKVIKNGYKYSIPASCKLLNEDYKVENHSFLAFMKECVVDRKPHGKITDDCTTARLYKVYEAWCKDNNNGYKETKKEINKILNELGKGNVKKTNGGYTYYEAITLSKEAKRDYENIYYHYNDYDDNNDVPKSDVNVVDVEEANVELGISDTVENDFSKEDVNIPNPDEFELGVGLNVTDEVLEEIGFNDIDVNNNENV